MIKIKTQWYKFIAILSLILMLLSFIFGIYGVYSSFGYKLIINHTEISDNLKLLVDSAFIINRNIVGIQIVKFDLPTNTRYVIYTKIQDPIINDRYNRVISTAVNLSFPIFTDNTKQNLALVRLINREFICSPFTETISYTYSPETAKDVSTVCAVATPSYGPFKGIVVFYLKNKPEFEEIDRIRIAIREISAIANAEIN